MAGWAAAFADSNRQIPSAMPGGISLSRKSPPPPGDPFVPSTVSARPSIRLSLVNKLQISYQNSSSNSFLNDSISTPAKFRLISCFLGHSFGFFIVPMALHPMNSFFGIHSLFAALALTFASVVKGCFPLMSPGGGCGGGCCMPGGCGDGGGAVPYAPSSPAYVYPSYPAQSSVPYAAKSRSMAMASSAIHTAASASFDSSCTKRYTDTRLNCALPFERRTPSDESECRRHCSNTMPRCRSFQFDPAGSVCDLFEHSLSPSSNRGHNFEETDQWNTKVAKQWREKAMKSKNKRRRRKRFFLQSGVPLDHQSRTMTPGVNTLAQMPSSPAVPSAFPSISSSSCVPTLEPFSGSVFVGFDSVCAVSSAAPPPPTTVPLLSTDDQSEETVEPTAEDNELHAPLPPPPTPTRKSSAESLEPFHPTTVASPGHKYGGKGKYGSIRSERTGNGVAELETSSSVGSSATNGKSDCPADGARAHVQLIDGIALSGQRPIGRVQLDSADVCLHVCRQNAFLDGRRLPSPCRSATFHRQNGRCEFLSDGISPNGALQYVPNPDSLYFEKICISRNELAPGCDDVIHRIPQHHLDPRRTTDGGTVQTASSQLDCVRKCISAKNKLGFNCASVSFFFDWPSQNCYLSRFTRLSRPNLYAAERREMVDYMEMPPCFQLSARVRMHDVPTESPQVFAWSQCIGGVRWRKKKCTKDEAEENDGDQEECVEIERESCGENGAGKGCGGTAKCGEDEKKTMPSAEETSKSFTSNLEVAKRFNGPPVASEEASLIDGQDYEDQQQKENSFFGPSHRTTGQSSEIRSLAEKTHSAKVAAEQCDEAKKCCPIETAKGMVRGCSLGRRTLADGRTTVSCVPDECQ